MSRLTDTIKAMVVEGEQISVNCGKSGCGNETRLASYDEALTYLSESQVSKMRNRVHLLLSRMNDTETHERTLAFLSKVASLKNRPYVVVQGEGLKVNEFTGTADEIVTEAMSHEEILGEVMPRIREHHRMLKDTATDSLLEQEPFESAKHSPLPAIHLDRYDPQRDEYNLLALSERLDGIHWLGACDADGTLIEPQSPDTILLHPLANYILKHHQNDFRKGHGGDLDALKDLIAYLEKWEDQNFKERKGLPLNLERVEDYIEYGQGIDISGEKSAAAFRGMHIDTLVRYGFEFVQTGLNGRIYKFVPDVLQDMVDHGILPFLVTGAPDFMLPSLLKMLHMTHGNGMTYKMNRDGILTGDIDVNLGLAKEKAKLERRLVQKGYGMAAMLGNSVGDIGSVGCAVHRASPKWDLSGCALIVNANQTTKEQVLGAFCNEHEEGRGRVQILDKDASSESVVAAFTLALSKVFEGKGANLENIKRMRDVLRTERLDEDGVKHVLGEHYPKELVEAAMKEYQLDMRNLHEVEAYLKRTGLTREIIKTIIAHNAEYLEMRGLLPPSIPRRHSTPPPFKVIKSDEDKNPD